MFHSQTKLPHLLSPESYYSETSWKAEEEGVFRKGWHVVAASTELAKHGAFVSCQVAGIPIQVRNFSGKLRALSNVCAHRHTLITSQPCGVSESMRCQYHGWEYQADGTTGKIPLPKNFVPVDREAMRLPVFHVESLGQLVFVNVTQAPQPLRDYLGEQVYSLLEQRFDERWRVGLTWRPEYPVNWKIPVENTLESYHVPAVHPNTFREDPGADRTQHVLTDRYTSMSTSLPFSPHSRLDSLFQSLESRFIKLLGLKPTNSYSQHHVFPNLLFSFTDAISLVHCVMPTSPQSSTATVIQFGRLPDSAGPISSPASLIWSKLKSAITKKILLEDLAIYEPIQQGLAASPHQGVLGICEERIHRFQSFMQQTCEYESLMDNTK